MSTEPSRSMTDIRALPLWVLRTGNYCLLSDCKKDKIPFKTLRFCVSKFCCCYNLHWKCVGMPWDQLDDGNWGGNSVGDSVALRYGISCQSCVERCLFALASMNRLEDLSFVCASHFASPSPFSSFAQPIRDCNFPPRGGTG